MPEQDETTGKGRPPHWIEQFWGQITDVFGFGVAIFLYVSGEISVSAMIAIMSIAKATGHGIDAQRKINNGGGPE